MTGHAVKMTEDRDRIVVNNKTKAREIVFFKGHTIDVKGLQQGNSRFRFRPTSDRECERAAESAFHLPEVCRQIYTETATLAYHGTIFYFPKREKVSKEINKWSRGLLPAQRNAITDIAVKGSGIADYFRCKSSSPLLDSLPGLERVHIYEIDCIFRVISLYWAMDDMLLFSNHPQQIPDFADWARERMHQIGNKNVEVICYPKGG